MKASPAGFKKLVQELNQERNWTLSWDEHKRPVERSRHQTVTIKVIRLMLFKSNDATVTVTYEEGVVEAYISKRDFSPYFQKSWSPADLYNLAKAVTFAAEIVEQFYLRKYGVEFAKVKEEVSAVA